MVFLLTMLDSCLRQPPLPATATRLEHKKAA